MQPELLAADFAVLLEPTDGWVEAGCQGVLVAKAGFDGERAHAARPWMGRNAIHRASEVLARARRARDRHRRRRRTRVPRVVPGGRHRGWRREEAQRGARPVHHHRQPPLRAQVLAGGGRGAGTGAARGRRRHRDPPGAAGAAPNLTNPLVDEFVRGLELPVRPKLGWTDVARFASRAFPPSTSVPATRRSPTPRASSSRATRSRTPTPPWRGSWVFPERSGRRSSRPVPCSPMLASPELYRWQLDALVSWLRCGRRGVIEAVTGSGKTDVAIAAAADALRRGRFVLVVVPSRVLMEQWHGRLTRRAARRPDRPAGRQRAGRPGVVRRARRDPPLGGRRTSRCRPATAGGLLIADECHGLGGGILRRAMLPAVRGTARPHRDARTQRRRGDRAAAAVLRRHLLPLRLRAGHRRRRVRAASGRVRRRRAVASRSGPSTSRPSSGSSTLAITSGRCATCRSSPFGDFLAAVAHLAERDAGADGRAARDYLDAFSKRRQIVAQTSGKYELLGSLAPAIRDADGALVFTETVRAANHAINRLDPLVSIDLITGSTARRQRREILDDLRVPEARRRRRAPRARRRHRRARRQPRHRHEREPHPPPDDPADGSHPAPQAPGVAARFVIMFAKDTLEDPANRIERDGFLDEIERISEATGVFDGAQFEELDAFLRAPGPETVPEPGAPRALRACRGACDRRGEPRSRRATVEHLAEQMGSRRRTRS